MVSSEESHVAVINEDLFVREVLNFHEYPVIRSYLNAHEDPSESIEYCISKSSVFLREHFSSIIAHGFC
jgi:hypothetical protein